MQYDVLVVGGSYAGMAAALQVVRARRSVAIVDAGERRNRFASHAHGFLGQDGRPPGEIAAEARRQLTAYPTLTWMEGRVRRAARDGEGFAVETDDGATHAARRLVLACGVTDTLPAVPGLAERWGTGVFHCPYCHGYELGEGRLGVLAVGPLSIHHAQLIPEWGPTTFFLNGAFDPDAGERADLAARGVEIEPTPVAAIVGRSDVRLVDGRVVALAGLFTAPHTAPASPVAAEIGCALEEGPLGSFVRTNAMKETTVPGVFACGDVARAMGSVSFAVGDGAMAGAAVHRSLVFG